MNTEIGSEHTIQLVKSIKGKKPVGRIFGKIALINGNEKVVAGASYIVRIDEEKDRFFIVTPLVVFKTKEQNDQELLDKIKLLKPEKNRVRKPKNRTPLYLRDE